MGDTTAEARQQRHGTGYLSGIEKRFFRQVAEMSICINDFDSDTGGCSNRRNIILHMESAGMSKPEQNLVYKKRKYEYIALKNKLKMIYLGYSCTVTHSLMQSLRYSVADPLLLYSKRLPNGLDDLEGHLVFDHQ